MSKKTKKDETNAQKEQEFTKDEKAENKDTAQCSSCEENIEKQKEQEKAEVQSEKEMTVVDKLKADLDSQKDMFLRLRAEYDNYRKRTQNEKLSIYDDATSRAVAEILPIADSITMALASLEGKDVPEEFTKGIELIAQQLKTSFEKLSITEFGEVGDEFNPEIHNAISKIEDENLKENTVSAVYQKGFMLKDKVVRHAMVQVANV